MAARDPDYIRLLRICRRVDVAVQQASQIQVGKVFYKTPIGAERQGFTQNLAIVAKYFFSQNELGK